MTLEDAKVWAVLLSETDDHIEVAKMLDDINKAFPEFEFIMGWGEDDYAQVSVVEK